MQTILYIESVFGMRSLRGNVLVVDDEQRRDIDKNVINTSVHTSKDVEQILTLHRCKMDASTEIL